MTTNNCRDKFREKEKGAEKKVRNLHQTTFIAPPYCRRKLIANGSNHHIHIHPHAHTHILPLNGKHTDNIDNRKLQCFHLGAFGCWSMVMTMMMAHWWYRCLLPPLLQGAPCNWLQGLRIFTLQPKKWSVREKQEIKKVSLHSIGSRQRLTKGSAPLQMLVYSEFRIFCYKCEKLNKSCNSNNERKSHRHT